MPAGKRAHKVRHYMRRIDAVLEEERERRMPPPPAISDEHRALRKRIGEAYRALLGSEASENADPLERVMENPELATEALKVQDMLFAEQDLLTRSGVNWQPYQPE